MCYAETVFSVTVCLSVTLVNAVKSANRVIVPEWKSVMKHVYNTYIRYTAVPLDTNVQHNFVCEADTMFNSESQ